MTIKPQTKLGEYGSAGFVSYIDGRHDLIVDILEGHDGEPPEALADRILHALDSIVPNAQRAAREQARLEHEAEYGLK